jgi:uncharacterized protein YchJ
MIILVAFVHPKEVRRMSPKPDEKCPCGSGKKFKECCGKPKKK